MLTWKQCHHAEVVYISILNVQTELLTWWATLPSVSELLLEDCGWNNDGSINWVGYPFPEKIQELFGSDFDAEDDKNEGYVEEECESEDDDDDDDDNDDDEKHRQTQNGHLLVQSQW